MFGIFYPSKIQQMIFSLLLGRHFEVLFSKKNKLRNLSALKENLNNFIIKFKNQALSNPINQEDNLVYFSTKTM